MIPRSDDGIQRILSLSYGKDSMACLGALDRLQWPLDRIVTVEVWATDTIQADLPPMVEFKSHADNVIRERWGIEVEHLCATDKNGDKLTYEKVFYRVPNRKPSNKMKFSGGGGIWVPGHGRIVVQETQNAESTGSLSSEKNGADISKWKHSQAFVGYYGFPGRVVNWCMGELKRPLFQPRP